MEEDQSICGGGAVDTAMADEVVASTRRRILRSPARRQGRPLPPPFRVAVEGRVEHKLDMTPHNENFEEYRKMCRERTNKSMIKNRHIEVIDDDRGVQMRPMPGLVGLGANKDKKKTVPVKPAEMNRTRRDRGELEDIMLKQLVQETDQPAQFLKEILNELCVYNK